MPAVREGPLTESKSLKGPLTESESLKGPLTESKSLKGPFRDITPKRVHRLDSTG